MAKRLGCPGPQLLSWPLPLAGSCYCITDCVGIGTNASSQPPAAAAGAAHVRKGCWQSSCCCCCLQDLLSLCPGWFLLPVAPAAAQAQSAPALHAASVLQPAAAAAVESVALGVIGPVSGWGSLLRGEPCSCSLLVAGCLVCVSQLYRWNERVVYYEQRAVAADGLKHNRYAHLSVSNARRNSLCQPSVLSAGLAGDELAYEQP